MTIQQTPLAETAIPPNPAAAEDPALAYPDQGEPLDDMSMPEDPFQDSMGEGEIVAGPWAKAVKGALGKYKTSKPIEQIKGQAEGMTPPKKPMEPDAPPPGASPEDFAASFKAGDKPLAGRVDPNNLNFDYFESPEEIKSAIQYMATDDALGTLEARRGVRSHTTTEQVADEGATIAAMLGKRDNWNPGDILNAEQMLGARRLLNYQGTELYKKANLLNNPMRTATEEEWMEFAQSQESFIATQKFVQGATAEIGRALNSMKIAAKDSDTFRTQQIAELIDSKGGLNNLKQRAKLFAEADGSPEAIAKLSRDTWGDRTGAMVREIWLSGLLSGPQTHMVNMFSNALVQSYEATLVKPIAAAVSGVRKGINKAQGVETSDMVYIEESIAEAHGLLAGTMDGLRMFGKSISDPNYNAEGLSKAEVQNWKAVTATNMNIDPTSKLGRGVDVIGDWYVRMPFRFLEAEDQLFKSIAYRRELNSQAYRTARSEGLNGDDLATRVNELVNSPTKELNEAARKRAEYQTYTNPADEAGGGMGRMAKAIQTISGKSVWGKFVVPFVRTPYNLAAYAVENGGPLAVLSKRWRNDMAAGGAKRDTAISRFILGSSVLTSVYQLHEAGAITGDGPENKRMNSMLAAQGWQPNSIKIGNTYVSYNRMDPIGMIVASMANGMDALKYSNNEEESKMLVAQMVLGLASNMTEKTYMQGISELMQAVNGQYGPVKGAANMVTGTVASFIPSWLNTVAKFNVPTNEEGQVLQQDTGYNYNATGEGIWMSLVKKAKARSGWDKADLPLRYDWKGEPIVTAHGAFESAMMPLRMRRGIYSPESALLQKHGIAIGRPSPLVAFGPKDPQVDLRDLDHGVGNVYAEYQKYVGQARLSNVKKAGVSGKDVDKIEPSDALAQKLREGLLAGLSRGKREFKTWYATEQGKHPDWVQYPSKEFQGLMKQKKGGMPTPHLQGELQPEQKTQAIGF